MAEGKGHAPTDSPSTTGDAHGNRIASRKALARGGGLSFIGSATSATLGFVLTVVITRLLGADGAGVVFQATGVFAVILAFAKVGMDSTAIYWLPRVQLDDVGKLRSSITAFALIASVASLLLGGLVFVLSPVLWPGAQGGVARAVQALMIFIPAGALMTIAAAILRALGSVREFVIVQNIAIPALRPPLVAVAAVATGSAVVVSVAWALPLAIMLLVAAVMIVGHTTRLEGGVKGEVRPSRNELREIISFAAPRTLSAGLEQAIVWSNVLLIGWLVSDQAAGIYGGAARFIQAGMIVDAALRVVVSPRFSSLLHQRRHSDVEDLYVTATMWLVLCASPIFLLLAVFSPVFLALLGPEFRAGANALSILAVGSMITFLAGNIHSLLIMSGHSGWAAVNKIIVLIVNVVGSIIVLPVWGLEGAAVVWASSTLIDALLAATQVSYFLDIRAPLWDVLRPLVLVLATFGIPAVVIAVVWGRFFWTLLAAGVIGLFLFVVAVRWQRKQLHISELLEVGRAKR